ncbi:FeoA family protein [Tessaracoccus lacteus]|uniref:Ferrous iron transport protein A n=1 Tax=Tessaracoccus lacteus TaxID=3041766 RepID=A0ABY8PY51_9ACTN|nr:ferrous iron transport protein A [Tessaracoccus sp. T21]WGT47337.1 ferrous iron transport protein A [Tessaracoccus sp. T21]
MTLVEQFAARRCTTPEELAGEQTRSLDALAVGEGSTVVGFEGDDVVVRRLFDLGFVPGVEVLRLRRAPLGDPIMFRVGGSEIVLRKAQAQLVKVARHE